MKILTIGLTGLCGSGKSTIMAMFREWGALTFNCDINAQLVQTKNLKLREKIIKKFGEQYYTGKVVNKEYAKSLYFAGTVESEKNLKWINKTISPYILQNFYAYKDSIEEAGVDGYIIIESAILFETGMNKICDLTINVKSPNPIGAAYGRDYMTKEEWQVRMKSQLPESEKKFDFVINNDYNIKNINDQVNQIHQKILEKIS